MSKTNKPDFSDFTDRVFALPPERRDLVIAMMEALLTTRAVHRSHRASAILSELATVQPWNLDAVCVALESQAATVGLPEVCA